MPTLDEELERERLRNVPPSPGLQRAIDKTRAAIDAAFDSGGPGKARQDEAEKRGPAAVDREALAGAMAAHQYAWKAGDLAPFAEQCPVFRQHWLAKADALIAGPLYPLLAQADTAAQAVAVLEKYEPRFRTDALRPELQTLDERVAFACHEAIDGREGERRLSERAGITLGVTATDGPAALLDALRAAAVERARLSAEVERLRAALTSIAEPDRLGAEDIYAGGGDDESVIAHLERRIKSRRLIARTALAAGQDKTESGKPTVPSTDAPAAAQEGSDA